MKKDWKTMARASGLAIPDEELERITAPLDRLEADFRPLADSLEPDEEPAIVFHPAPKGAA